jgi:hypothetical protein
MPIDIGSIAAVTTSLQTLTDMTKAFIGVRDAVITQDKVLQLQQAIMSAHSAALSAQTEQYTLLECVRELEKQISDIEAWDEEKVRYELKEVSSGAYAYVPRQDEASREPFHWLCATCFQDRAKSVLQYAGPAQRGRESHFRCGRCKTVILATWGHGAISGRGRRSSAS